MKKKHSKTGTLPKARVDPAVGSVRKYIHAFLLFCVGIIASFMLVLLRAICHPSIQSLVFNL
jgi:hypothetical protein